MKPLKKFFMTGLALLFVIFLISFISDGYLFFLASSDDKIYGEDNKYIDPNLVGQALNDPSNIKDSYKLQTETTGWQLILFKFFSIFLKLLLILIVPLLFYYLFINKDSSVPEFFLKMFSRR